ncbi:DUF4114 domain-containing protein [Laspinema olomoucense]|uniref:DUF4114 domain-containing protein n=1 Tax=Laspinema olomoucense TaxID=3231600 RepID=UPI0021BB93C9|nr:DUF4114 domain-containing protein [Laspinema sp. D3c]MCT7997206.1 DUF4114 domain-containing protein [Laspinema sp. D3c]
MPLDGAYPNTQETFGIDPLLKGLEHDPLSMPPSSGGYEPEDKLPQDSGFDKDLVSNPNFYSTGIKSDELGTSPTSISSGKVEASTVESDVDPLTKQPLKEEANPLPDETDPLLNPRPSAAVEEEAPSETTVDSEGVDEENDSSVDEPVSGDTARETTSSVKSDDENGVTDEGDEIADNNSLFVTNETDDAAEEAEVTTDDTVNSIDAIVTEERDEIVSGDSLFETTGESDMEAGDNTASGAGETDEDAEVATDVTANLETQANEITATDETVSDGVVEEDTTTGDTDDAADSQTEADEITATDETVSDGVVEEETTTEDVENEESDRTENAVTEERKTSSELNPADDTAGEDNTVGETAEIADSGDEEIETDVTGETEDNAGEDATATDDAAEDGTEVVLDESIATSKINFDMGIFKVDASGEVGINFLFDGGAFKSQVAIVSLSGMEGLDPNSVEFIREAATRAASNTELGYVVIDDVNEGAKFTGRLGEGNYNFGTYEGVKTFRMRPGDEFFLMLVPNGTVQQVIDNPTASGGIRPLFSIATANPHDAYHAGQIADLTGDGSAFAWEDLRFDRGTDKDYNDIVLQIRGAKGKAALMDEVVAEGKDWRNTDMGQAVMEYVKAYITPDAPDFDSAISDLIGELEDLTAGEETDIETDSGEEAISNEGIEDAIADGNNPETEETVDEIADSEGEDPIASDEIEEAVASDVVVGDEVEDAIASNDTVAEEIDNSSASDDTVAGDTSDTDPNETVNEVSDTDTAIAPETEEAVTDSPEDSSSELVESSVEETDATTEVPSVTADSVIDESESVEDSTEKDASEINALVEEVETEIESSTETSETTESSTQPVATESADNSGTEILPATPEVVSSDNSATPDTAVAEGADNTTSETPVVEITPAEVEPLAESDSVATDEDAIATGSETADNAGENGEIQEAIAPNTQPVNPVNTQLISRLETLTQTLKGRGTDAVVSGGTSVTPALVERLETLTESLKTQNNSQPVSANTTALVSRLEEMVVRSLPPAPIAPGSFEFPQKNQPLVGAINETGFTANNPNVDYSRITPLKDRVEGDDNPFVTADDSANSDKTPLEIIKEINKNVPLGVGRALGNSEDWAQSVIEYVDTAKASGQPNAILNLNLKLTEVNENGEVVPRYQLTPNQRAAIAYAQKNNIIIVVPAGDIPEEMSALGQLSTEFDNVMTVGTAQRINNAIAISKAYAPAENSGSGAALDIVADGGTGGTLEASAQVTGAMSQVWAANPKLNYTQVMDILKRTATDLSQPNWDATTGAGMVNAIAAVELAKATLPELYTVKPGARTITDNFISQPNADKELPGDPTHPAIQPPGIPQTDVDTGGNNIANATQLLPSATVDVIDQVSAIDPTDIYRVESRYLDNAEFSVLSGEVSVSYLTSSGQLLSTQVLTKGTHQLQLPANAPEEAIVRINRRGGNPATYVLSGFEPVVEESFNINLEFESPLTASQKQVMQAAAKNVAALIGKGLPSAVVDGKIIDDLNIKISTANIDGASGTQARTKIDFMRYGSLLPAQSLVQFDAADIAELEQSGQLFDVVQHEFLHALGFGNLWEAKGLVNYPGTPLAQYNGENAVEEFQKLGGLTDFVSLETEGDGSAGFHWNEMLFQNELMTADLNGNGSGGNAPISAVTLASLADLGYEVNLGGATSDYQLFGGEGFNPDELTPEQVEAFRELAETSFEASGEEYIAPIMPTVDPDKVSPEIWAHAERFSGNNEYYDWVPYQVQWGDTLSGLALRFMGNGSYAYYKWIGDRNGVKNYDYLHWDSNNPNNNWIEVPKHHPNYEWKQEQERLQREAELKQKQEQEARQRREQEERLAREKAEQERKAREEEERQREAERQQRELEEQERRLREEMERRRQEEERRKEEERLRELERQREIARQQGKGGQDWFFATRLPEFGPTDPFETKLTGETVGNLVPDDYYRFTLSRKGRIDARLMNLLADADLVLYDARNRPISYSMREGITDEQILVDLIPGTYMLRVNSPGGVTTDYDLIVKFKHLLSRTEQGPPEGWQVGGSAGGAGGGIPAGATFADPRIKRIYDTALGNFAAAERAKANTTIRNLEAEKLQYEQELKALLDQMNAEQRAKVHSALDGVRHNANVWADNTANGIKSSIDGTTDWIINQIEGKIHHRLRDLDFVRNAIETFKGAVNGARSWLKERVGWAQDRVKHFIWHFIETVKNAYRTGGEINTIIENAASDMKRGMDSLVGSINNWVGEFKGKILGGLDWLRNIRTPDWLKWLGVPDWNFYDGVAVPLTNSIGSGVQSAVSSVGDLVKGSVNWIKPRTQKAVAAIADALFGDQTGHLYNKINGVDAQIAATRTGLEKAIEDQGNLYKRLLDDFLNGLGEAKDFVLGAIFGGFNDEATLLQILFDTVLPSIVARVIDVFFPGVGVATEIGLSLAQGIRDLVAELFKAVPKVMREESLDAGNWLGLISSAIATATAAIPLAGPYLRSLIRLVGQGSKGASLVAKLGKVPILGDVIKEISKLDWPYLGKAGSSIVAQISNIAGNFLGTLSDGIKKLGTNFNSALDQIGISGLVKKAKSLVEQIPLSLVKISEDTPKHTPSVVNEIKEAFAGFVDSTVDTGWSTIGKTVNHPSVVEQLHIYYCGPASVEMLLKSQGISTIDQFKIAESIKGVEKDGSSVDSVAKALQEFSGNNKWKPMGPTNFPFTKEDVESMTKNGSWIAKMKLRRDHYPGATMGHFVVVDSITANNTVIIRDPSEGAKYEMKLKEFLEFWEGLGVASI